MLNLIENFFIDKFIWFTNEHPVIFIFLLIGIPFLILAFLFDKIKNIGEAIFDKISGINNTDAEYITQNSFLEWTNYNKLNKKIKKETKKELKKLPKNYWFEEDVCIVDGDKKIYYDFIIFSENIFCPIIIQNTIGILSGSINNSHLLHSLNKTKQFRAPNPLKDCLERKHSLAKFLGLETNTSIFTPFIVFSDNCRLSLPYSLNFTNTSNLIKNILIMPHTGLTQTQILDFHKKIIVNSTKNKKIQKEEKMRIAANIKKNYSDIII